MGSRIWLIGLGLSLGVSASLPAQPLNTVPQTDKAVIRSLINDWLIVGWRHLPTDPPFSFAARLSKYYDWSAKDLYLFDDFDEQKRVARSPAEYGAIWDAALPSMKLLSNKVLGQDILVSGNLAVDTVNYEITIDTGSGPSKRSTLDTVVLRRGPQGWKIIREQGAVLTDKGMRIEP